MPGGQCETKDLKLFLDQGQMVVTGKTDDQGRMEILTKAMVTEQAGTGPIQPVSTYVQFYDLTDSNQWIGKSYASSGCVFAKIFAPASAVGKVIRLHAGDMLCPAEAVLDLTIPAQTAETALDPCPGWTTAPIWTQIHGLESPADEVKAYQERQQSRCHQRPGVAVPAYCNDAGSSSSEGSK